MTARCDIVDDGKDDGKANKTDNRNDKVEIKFDCVKHNGKYQW